jgi:hypothetical protein
MRSVPLGLDGYRRGKDSSMNLRHLDVETGARHFAPEPLSSDLFSARYHLTG